jgi:glycosyltransferase involved in cell wall biosynthesis
MNAPELSLVIPTYNERDSLAPLMAELHAALAGIDWEVVFVDDSTDGTDRIIAYLSLNDSRIRLLHRDVNRDGLAGAVVDGLQLARGNYICVLDADLQHPPERIPDLLEAARANSADVVVASRYVPGGSASGLDGPLRQFYSRGLKVLSQRVFPKRLASISDPLGGYFLLRRAVIQDADLRPIGYKILLEILIRGTWTKAREVPYRFQPRCAGTSKANLRQGLRFLHHLARLAWDCSPSLAPVRAVAHAVSGGAAVAAPIGV